MERYFRNGVLAAAASAVVIGGAVTAWAAKELVVVSWGGAYSASQQNAKTPFRK